MILRLINSSQVWVRSLFINFVDVIPYIKDLLTEKDWLNINIHVHQNKNTFLKILECDFIFEMHNVIGSGENVFSLN
jgi:hypothetical protein